jgi:hypothetical protein
MFNYAINNNKLKKNNKVIILTFSYVLSNYVILTFIKNYKKKNNPEIAQ